MAIYSSQPVRLTSPAESVYSKLSNLENLRSLLERIPSDKVPEDQKAMLDNITISPDSISVPAGPVGNLDFVVTERKEPSLVKLSAQNSPVPMSLALCITPESDAECTAKVDIDINIPPMLRPMVGDKIQQVADKFSLILKAISFA